MKDYITVGELEKRTGLHESTIRRYLKHYEEYFDSQKMGRATKYDPAAAEKLLKIYSYLNQHGLSSDEVREALEEEYNQIVTVAPDEKIGRVQTKHELAQQMYSDLQEIKKQFGSFEEMKQKLSKLDKLDRLDQLERKIEERIEERDKKLLRYIRYQQKPWWRKIFSKPPPFFDDE